MPRGARLHGCGGVREGGNLAHHLDLFRTPSALYPATLYSSEATVYKQTSFAPKTGWGMLVYMPQDGH